MGSFLVSSNTNQNGSKNTTISCLLQNVCAYNGLRRFRRLTKMCQYI